jgi:hypothetical protein
MVGSATCNGMVAWFKVLWLREAFGEIHRNTDFAGRRENKSFDSNSICCPFRAWELSNLVIGLRPIRLS